MLWKLQDVQAENERHFYLILTYNYIEQVVKKTIVNTGRPARRRISEPVVSSTHIDRLSTAPVRGSHNFVALLNAISIFQHFSCVLYN